MIDVGKLLLHVRIPPGEVPARAGKERFPARLASLLRLYFTFLIQPNWSAILPVWIPVRVS